jgi:hypothetical protein
MSKWLSVYRLAVHFCHLFFADRWMEAKHDFKKKLKKIRLPVWRN